MPVTPCKDNVTVDLQRDEATFTLPADWLVKHYWSRKGAETDPRNQTIFITLKNIKTLSWAHFNIPYGLKICYSCKKLMFFLYLCF